MVKLCLHPRLLEGFPLYGQMHGFKYRPILIYIGKYHMGFEVLDTILT